MDRRGISELDLNLGLTGHGHRSAYRYFRHRIENRMQNHTRVSDDVGSRSTRCSAPISIARIKGTKGN